MAGVLRYLGHSAFYIKKGDYGILIDPFLSQNPSANFDLNKEKVTHILVTHGHGDHLGDAIPISKATGAQVVAVFELANYCASKGANALPVGLGCDIKLGWGSACFLPAVHTSSLPDGGYAGVAAGILLDIDGVKIFHAGDTALSQEMILIKEVYQPYFALLPIGGHYTMGIKEAAIAAKLLGAKEIIPMHYNTFDVIKTNTKEFDILIENQNQKCIVLKPNESIEI